MAHDAAWLGKDQKMFRCLMVLFLLVTIPISPSAAGNSDKLTVLLSWFINPSHAPLVIAKELGYFKASGLSVDLIPPTDPSAPTRLVSAGKAEIALTYQPNHYLDVDAGLPTVRFGTMVETPLNTLTVLGNGPIRTIADLKGRKIGFSVSGFENAILARILSSAGLKTEDVELVNVNFALSTSLLTGRVDATIGGFRNFDLAQLRLEGRQGYAFYPEEHGVPAYEELIFVTHRDLVKDDRLPRFLEAIEKATLYLTNHPEEAWRAFVHAYPELDNELNREAWFSTLPRFAKRPAALDRGRYERFYAFLKEQGLVKKPLAIDEIAITVR